MTKSQRSTAEPTGNSTVLYTKNAAKKLYRFYIVLKHTQNNKKGRRKLQEGMDMSVA